MESVILEELSQVVSRELKDPRIPPLTFTSVIVAHDGSHATIQFIPLGATSIDPNEMTEAEEKAARKKAQDCLEGLTSASGFLRRHLAKVLNVRTVPTLSFKEDRGFENATRVHDLLKKMSSGSSGG